MSDRVNSVNLQQAATLIRATWTNSFANMTRPQSAMLHGSPGIGKSSIIAAVAEQMQTDLSNKKGVPCKVHVIDLRLSAMEASDVQGIPYVDTASGPRKLTDAEVTAADTTSRMRFSTPEWWPSFRQGEKDENGVQHWYILFLDELSNSPMYVQHAAYRLVMDRSIQNGSVMDNNVAIVAAGNLKEDKTGAKPIAPALANRFGLHLEIDSASVAGPFLEYAIGKNFHPMLVAFLEYKKANVFNMNDVQNDYTFATPRSWEFANDHVRNELIANDEGMLSIAIAGAVGSEKSHEFMGFKQYFGQLPDWTKVRSGELKYDYKSKSGDQQLGFALSIALAYEMGDAASQHNTKDAKGNTIDMKRDIDNLFAVAEQLGQEMQIVCIRSLKARDTQKFVQLRSFDGWNTVVKPILNRISNAS